MHQQGQQAEQQPARKSAGPRPPNQKAPQGHDEARRRHQCHVGRTGACRAPETSLHPLLGAAPCLHGTFRGRCKFLTGSASPSPMRRSTRPSLPGLPLCGGGQCLFCKKVWDDAHKVSSSHMAYVKDPVQGFAFLS